MASSAFRFFDNLAVPRIALTAAAAAVTASAALLAVHLARLIADNNVDATLQAAEKEDEERRLSRSASGSRLAHSASHKPVQEMRTATVEGDANDSRRCSNTAAEARLTTSSTTAATAATPPPDLSACGRLAQFEAEAQRRLPPYIYTYFAYTAGRRAPARGADAFAAQQLLPMTMARLDVASAAEVDTAWELFGCRYNTPFMVAPTGFHRLLHPQGELVTARACRAVGACYVYNYMYSTIDAAEVAAVGGAPWASLYLYQDREHTLHAVRRCESLGFAAIVLTCDHVHNGVREATMPLFDKEGDAAFLKSTMVFPNARAYWRDAGLEDQAAVGCVDPRLGWEDVKWLKAQTGLPLIVKGLLSENDARAAIRAGVDGIIVSNHGFRQTDSGPAAVDALQRIALVTRGRCALFLDSGVRCGQHALAAAAHGATAVLVGRPPLWGLAVDGQTGVETVLQVLTRDLQNEMLTVGCSQLQHVGPSVLAVKSQEDY
jgi:4-hydroxymandelate oxidase